MEAFLEWLSSNELTNYPFKEDCTLLSTGGLKLPQDLLVDAVIKGGEAEDRVYLSDVITDPSTVFLYFSSELLGAIVAEFEIPKTSSSVRKLFYSGPVDSLSACGAMGGPGLPGAGLTSTGTGDVGLADPVFSLTTTPGPTGAIVKNAITLPVGYVTAPVGTQWIGPGTSDGGVDATAGLYIYETVINLTGYDPTTVKLRGQWSADNAAEIYVNGSPTGITLGSEAYGSLTEFEINSSNSALVAGANTLEFYVTNDVAVSPNPTNLLVEFFLSGDSPSLGVKIPNTFEMRLLPGAGLLTLGDALDEDFTVSTAQLEPSVLVPRPSRVLSLADKDDPLECLQGDVYLGDGYNMQVVQNLENNSLDFTAGQGLGLGSLIQCPSLDEVPRRIRTINLKPGERDTANARIVTGDDCIEIKHYRGSNMIVIHDHCRECCDCERLVDLDDRITALEAP